ncbi:MAG: flagellar hook-basal body complex protein FliE [Actinomycetia bacterium]|nr:flagellar hook-basal body complex protein FliE [Actinomycetes bacterium]
MSVAGIGGINAVPDPRNIAQVGQAEILGTEPAEVDSGLGQTFADALSQIDEAQRTAASAAVDAATGDLQSVSEYMVASAEAQLATQVTVAIRNRAVEAFNDIMRMQI